MDVFAHGRAVVFAGLVALCGCAKDQPALFAQDVNDDSGIQQSVLTYWRHDHPKDGDGLAVSVSQGVVSLTGTVATPLMRVDAVRDAWLPGAVREVVNEVKVSQDATQSSRKDQATSIKLRTRLTFDPDMLSTDYSVETVDGTIYLIGVYRDTAELDKVKRMAEALVGPGKVVTYARPFVEVKSAAAQ